MRPASFCSCSPLTRARLTPPVLRIHLHYEHALTALDVHAQQASFMTPSGPVTESYDLCVAAGVSAVTWHARPDQPQHLTMA